MYRSIQKHFFQRDVILRFGLDHQCGHRIRDKLQTFWPYRVWRLVFGITITRGKRIKQNQDRNIKYLESLNFQAIDQHFNRLGKVCYLFWYQNISNRLTYGNLGRFKIHIFSHHIIFEKTSWAMKREKFNLTKLWITCLCHSYLDVLLVF